MSSTKIPFGFKFQIREAKHNSPTGEKIQIEHRPEMGLDGRRKLIGDKKVNIYEMIQASREQTEIERIVKRALEGDMSALNATNAQFVDITGAPKSLAEAQQIIINAKRDFDLLDTETKKKFDNNVEVFIAEAGSKDWLDKMGYTEALEKKKAAKAKEAEFQKNLEAGIANLAGAATKNEGVTADEQ